MRVWFPPGPFKSFLNKIYLVAAGLITVIIILIHEILFDLLGLTAVLYNDQVVLLFIIFAVVISSLLLLIAIQQKNLAISLGVFTGAICSNILGRLIFGPVPDYIPVPFTDGHYANIGDALIFFTPWPILFFLKNPLVDFLKEGKENSSL